MIHGHGGNIFELADSLNCAPGDITDMSSNLNPLGPMPALLDFLRSNMELVTRLPQADARTAIDAFSTYTGVDSRQVAAGNGTTELIYALPAALRSRRVLIVAPTYADYADACRLEDIEPEFMVTAADTRFIPDMDRLQSRCRQMDTVFLCNPNNPAGYHIPSGMLGDLCRQHPDTRFVIDESYLPFVDGDRGLAADLPENAVVLISFSKIFTIPGLRTGFAVGCPDIIDALKARARPWNVNALAQAAVARLYGTPEPTDEFITRSRAYVAAERRRIMDRLGDHEWITLFPSDTSFILMRLNGSLTSDDVCRQLADQRILIRDCRNFHGLSNRFIRVSLKDPDANRRVAAVLARMGGGTRKAMTDGVRLPDPGRRNHRSTETVRRK